MKKPTVIKLKKKLDAIFSLYIRRRYADDRGYVTCVSCSRKKPIKEMQCGHYIGRAHNATRYDQDNCFPQCAGCNVFQHGNYPAFTRYLLENYGEEFVLALERKGRTIKQFTIWELQTLITYYGHQTEAKPRR